MNMQTPEVAIPDVPKVGLVKESEQTETREAINAGLQTLKVIPKWRKVIVGGDDIESFAAISRLSPETQAMVLAQIAEYYQAQTAAEDQFIGNTDKITPKTKWSTIVTKGHNNRLQGVQATIKKLDQQILAADLKIKDPNNIPTQSDYEAIDQLKAERAKHQTNLTNLQSQDIELAVSNIKAMMQKDCLPAYAQNLGSGYLYVFLKDAQVQVENQSIYSDAHLFKEYQITSDGINYQFSEVDINFQAGEDIRQANEASSPFIELPAAFVKQNTKDPNDDSNVTSLEQVNYFYSPTQLSWARVHQYGGLAENDPRVTHSLTLPSNNEVLNALMGKPTDSSLFSETLKRVEQPKPDNLKSIWQQQVLSRYQPEQTIYLDKSQSQWETLRVFAVESDTSDLPYVLLNDPFGLYLEQVQQILYSQRQISDIVNQIQGGTKNNVADAREIEMKTAVLAWQSFFNPKAMGLIKVNGLSNPMYDITGIPDAYQQHWKILKERYDAIMKGQSDLDESKLQYALKKHSRDFFKALMRFQQTQACDQLKQPVFSALWQDHFSAGLVNYISVHTQFWGMIQPLCIDPNSIDQDLESSVLPLDEIELQVSANVVGVDMWAGKGSVSYQGYKHTQYTLSGYQIIKTVTEYGTECDKTTGNPIVKSREITEKPLIEPPGYKQFLDPFVLPDGTPLHMMLFADETNPDFEETIADNKRYLQGQGHYNGTLLGQGQDLLAQLLDDNEKLTNQGETQADKLVQARFDAVKDKL
ncbi:hypothetical protein OAO18_09270, partial [Francisellaceae bacterium]|nr:hypothetical protein [Francisellaceae bacterium]